MRNIRNRGSAQVKLIILGVVLVLGLVALFSVFRPIEAEGSERIVWQTYSGVSDDVGMDGLHFYCPAITTPNLYYIGTDTFIIDDKTVNPKNTYMDAHELQFNQPDVPPVPIPVQMDKLSAADLQSGKTTGPTNIKMSCVMQFHLDPDPVKLVALHKQKTHAYRTTFLKDVLLETIISSTTILDARTVYQGAGRVKLQNTIQQALRDEPRFVTFGIVVEKFIIREVEFEDKVFLGKIQLEALAEQRRKTAVKEERANLAEASAAQAKAMTLQLERLVEADTKKGERIAKAEAAAREKVLAAEASKQQVTLAAEANKDKLRLEGEGEQLRDEAKASGILAVGQATAEAKKLQLEAYQGEGGRRFAEVEKAKHLGAGIEKIYYIPADMSINTISSDFAKAITIGLPSN